jgi:hypothetical protein
MPIFREIEEGRADRVNIMLETDDMKDDIFQKKSRFYYSTTAQ